MLTPEVEAEIASFESWGGEAVKGRVADALLSAAGHKGEDAAIRAYTSLKGLLFEIVRRREAAETLKLDAASRSRFREKTKYHALRKTPDGLEVVERASPSESDVPEVQNSSVIPMVTK